MFGADTNLSVDRFYVWGWPGTFPVKLINWYPPYQLYNELSETVVNLVLCRYYKKVLRFPYSHDGSAGCSLRAQDVSIGWAHSQLKIIHMVWKGKKRKEKKKTSLKSMDQTIVAFLCIGRKTGVLREGRRGKFFPPYAGFSQSRQLLGGITNGTQIKLVCDIGGQRINKKISFKLLWFFPSL